MRSLGYMIVFAWNGQDIQIRKHFFFCGAIYKVDKKDTTILFGSQRDIILFDTNTIYLGQ